MNINLKFLSVLLLIVTATQAIAQPMPPNGMKWEVVNEMTDEFNNGFDDNKWVRVLWNYGGTPTRMIAENSGVTDGNLWIKATLGPEPLWFQSSRVYSKAEIKYPMYTECSIITAHISAYNTFWLNKGDINNRDEIDVIENNSRPSCGCQPNFPWQMNSQYFHAENGEANTIRNKGNYDNRRLSDDNPKKGIAWNETYHTVGVWWKDERNITFYLDGEEAGSVVVGQHNNGQFFEERIFTRNQQLIWDLWTRDADWLGGLADKSHLSDDSINTMRVDWVHTFKLVEDTTLSNFDVSNPAELATVYPNPVNDELNIYMVDLNKGATATLYDNNGRLILTEELKSDKDQVSLSELAKGIYYLKIKNGNSESYKSIVKE
ncbi:T9SS type A sorting domain-containing protein [Aquimarina agarilytica]|uniref:T9SS type A sorting domain-containing protein n=1 Tax=Aquimarina agarilytica TaxID=1087449 RepID=UPI00028822A6|nr:T9SS type A sorting domain-containing protein [Aquimarina agarilytica]